MDRNHRGLRVDFIRELCSELPEEDVRQTEENFLAFLDVVRRIAARRESGDGEAAAVHSADSTVFDSDSTIPRCAATCAGAASPPANAPAPVHLLSLTPPGTPPNLRLLTARGNANG